MAGYEMIITIQQFWVNSVNRTAGVIEESEVTEESEVIEEFEVNEVWA